MTYKSICADGNILVVRGDDQKPVALFYAHNVPYHVAKCRANKFIKAMSK